MQKELVKLANHLDSTGHKDLADRIDSILKTAKKEEEEGTGLKPKIRALKMAADTAKTMSTGDKVNVFRAILKLFFDEAKEGRWGKFDEANFVEVSLSNPKWSRDLQKGWESFTSHIGRDDLTKNWKSLGPKAGYPGASNPQVGDMLGMLQYTIDWMEAAGTGRGTSGGSSDVGAVAKSWYDSYISGDEDHKRKIRTDPNLASHWSEIQNYAQRMGKELPQGAALAQTGTEESGGVAQTPEAATWKHVQIRLNELGHKDKEGKELATDNDFGARSKQAWVNANKGPLPSNPKDALALLVDTDRGIERARERRDTEDAFASQYEEFDFEEDAAVDSVASNASDRIEKAADLLSGIFSNGEIPSVRR
jgi:hypothetical protein